MRSILALMLLVSVASASADASEAKKTATPASAEQAAAALRKTLEIALSDVCARHAALERCFLVLARDANGRPGLWFVPVFDGAIDSAALGQAQQVWTRLVPGGGQIPMMLLPRDDWRRQLAGVKPMYIRPAKK